MKLPVAAPLLFAGVPDQKKALAGVFVSVACLFVWCGCGGTKGGSFHSAAVKKLSNVPAALRMPTGESKARREADKEGLMPTSSSHRRDFPASLARSKKQNGGTARATTIWLRCEGMGRHVGHVGTREARGRKRPRLCDPGEECRFVFAKVSTTGRR